MKVKLNVIEKVEIHHSIIVEVESEEEVDVLTHYTYDDATIIDDVVGEIESYDFIKVLDVEEEVFTDPEGFEVYNDGEIEED